MFRCASLLLLAAAGANARFDRYAGEYKPVTQITDEAALDLDQLIINEQLYKRKNKHAMWVYTEGGHSGSYAVMTLNNLSGSKSYPKGTKVIGESESGSEVVGFLDSDYSWDASATDAMVNVTYKVEDSQANYMTCRVGGLYKFSEATRDGCFTDAAGSTVRFVLDGAADADYDAEYTYNFRQREDDLNSRTLQGLSRTTMDRFLKVKDKYFEEFQQFLNYYGESDYADRWILAADEKRRTDFRGNGNNDFSIMSDRPGPGEAMKKGDAYLIFWMEVANQLERAVHQCGKAGAQHHVDLAVAYYAGSLSTEADTKEGILLNALAEVRSHQSKTATHSGDQAEGGAYVNLNVFRLFREMQGYVAAGADTQDCGQALLAKDEILTLMKIPLVQGVIRYAHKRQYEFPELLIDQERVRAEGAVFAATVLPFVDACNPNAAKVIHDYMRVESTNSKFRFAAVRDALESTYACMGFTCERIGGVWDENEGKWKTDGQPCGGSGSSDEGGMSVGGVFGLMFGLVLAGWVFLRYRHKFFPRRKEGKGLPEMYTGNIAAVSEIS